MCGSQEHRKAVMHIHTQPFLFQFFPRIDRLLQDIEGVPGDARQALMTPHFLPRRAHMLIPNLPVYPRPPNIPSLGTRSSIFHAESESLSVLLLSWFFFFNFLNILFFFSTVQRGDPVTHTGMPSPRGREWDGL